MEKLKLSFACGLYDRMVRLYTGEVQPAGIELDFQPSDDPRAIFDKMGGEFAYDVSEMSTSELISRKLAGDSPFVALPVFPSRVFRHGFIYVNTDSGITSPKQLAGKRIGVPIYGMSAALWIRGTLADEYGADFSDVTWVQGSMTAAGTHGTPSLTPLLKPVRIEDNKSSKSLSALLADGEIDALMSSRIVDGLGTNPKLRRLIADHREVEKDYFRRTGIFPIMHSIAIRKEVYEANPWIAQSLYDAFCEAKSRALTLMREVGSLKYMLPWLPSDLDEIREVFGGDPWPYGLERNRKVLETAVRYLAEQGLTDRTVPVDDLYIRVDETRS
ncbi:MAG: ABC transporter substrate-binding protein [Hyphomicrobiales bacterium]|nr:MAG: ABC transporter substrate-binding protein [Hyphomicrobiales bacterium]